MALYRVVHHADGTLFVYCDHRGEAGFYAGLVRYGKVTLATDASCGFVTSKLMYGVSTLDGNVVPPWIEGAHAAANIAEELVELTANNRKSQ